MKRFEPFALGRAKWDTDVLAWLRRIIVSVGVGGASYAIMLAIAHDAFDDPNIRIELLQKSISRDTGRIAAA